MDDSKGNILLNLSSEGHWLIFKDSKWLDSKNEKFLPFLPILELSNDGFRDLLSTMAIIADKNQIKLLLTQVFTTAFRTMSAYWIELATSHIIELGYSDDSLKSYLDEFANNKCFSQKLRQRVRFALNNK